MLSSNYQIYVQLGLCVITVLKAIIPTFYYVFSSPYILDIFCNQHTEKLVASTASEFVCDCKGCLYIIYNMNTLSKCIFRTLSIILCFVS